MNRAAPRFMFLSMLLVISGGCSGFSVIPPDDAGRPPAVIDAMRELDKAPDQDLAVVTLVESSSESFHLIRVRDRVTPHIHEWSDETVYILQGEGDLLLDQEWRRVRAGMLIHVPKGVPHAYINRGATDTLVLSAYSPPFRQGDRVFLEEE